MALVIYLVLVVSFGWLSLLVLVSPIYWFYMSISAVLGLFLAETCYYYSQEVLGPAKATAISLVFPFFTFGFAFIFQGKLNHELIIVGSVIVIVGISIITLDQHNTKKDEEITTEKFSRKKIAWSIILALIATAGWAISLVYTEIVLTHFEQKFSSDVDTTVVINAFRVPIGVLFVFSFYLTKSKAQKPLRTIKFRTGDTYHRFIAFNSYWCIFLGRSSKSCWSFINGDNHYNNTTNYNSYKLCV